MTDSIHFGDRRLDLVRGDITTERVDAIGNAANESLRGGGAHGEPELLTGAYRSSLRLADELGARSIAFPAISMGIYGYPPPDGARVAVETVAEHLADATRLDLVRFVLYSEETYDLFADALREVS